jgi:hypothetical protein
MAQRLINVTITEQQIDSGPLYDVYYSINGTDYILSATGVNLPNIGSSATIFVDERYCRVRLVDASSTCEGTTNTIDVGICCSPAINPVLSLDYEDYTSGSLIWSGSDTSPKSSSVTGGLAPAPVLQGWRFNGTTNAIAMSSSSLAGMQNKDFTINIIASFPSSSLRRAILGNPSYNNFGNFGADAIIRYDISSSQMALDLRQADTGTEVNRYMMPINTSSLQMLTIRQDTSTGPKVFLNKVEIPAVGAGLGQISFYNLFSNINNFQQIFVGFNLDVDTQNYNGDLADIRIYSRSLSVNEIEDDYFYYIDKCIIPTTTTTSTTTIGPLNFDISQSCYQNDGVVRIYNPTGGGGTYQFNEIAYFSQASALAATTNWVTTGSITFNDLPDGTLWYALRDAANTSNIIAKSATVNCNTSSNECYTSASFTVGNFEAEVFWQDCCTNVSSSFFAVGNHIISGCIKVGSINSPGNVGNPEYYGITCSCGCTGYDYICGDGTETFNTGSNLYGVYPTSSVCPTSNECGTFVYDAFDRPNRFNLYDNGGLVATSGWVGYADYSGPWGSDLNVSPNGSFTYDFSTTLGRYVEIEYGPASPTTPISDSAEWSLTCGTCPTTTTTSTTTTSPLYVTLAFGFMQPCIGGTIDDYMGASVTLNDAVSVDTEVVVNVSYVFPGNGCGVGASTQAIYLTIPSGSASDNFNACTNGIYFSGGANICDACVASCDNPAVDISTASC